MAIADYFDITTLFNLANVFVLPFWILMILLPNWSVTQRIMGSYLPFVVLAGLYLYLLSGAVNAEIVQISFNPTLSDVARVFSNPRVAAIGWVHLLVMDLFVGRWIYLDGQSQPSRVWTTHSIILCLFAGPLGLLSHIATCWLTETFSKQTDANAVNSTPSQE
jgi:hypothetical protein